MSKIRWYELPEARQLASLGKQLSKAGRQRLPWMLFYSFNGRNVARTCRHFGISRQTFYRWKRRFDRHDLSTLEGRSHRPKKQERGQHPHTPILIPADSFHSAITLVWVYDRNFRHLRTERKRHIDQRRGLSLVPGEAQSIVGGRRVK